MASKKQHGRERIAYHESGHAVVAYFEHLPFRYVTIIPESWALGHVGYGRTPDERGRTTKWFRPDVEVTARVRRKIESHIKVSYAGPIAEKKFGNRPRIQIGDSEDHRQASDLADYVTNSNPKAGAHYLAWLYETVAEELEDEQTWAAVRAVAEALLERQRLTHAEVAKICQVAV